MGFKGFHDLKLALANELAVFEQARARGAARRRTTRAPRCSSRSPAPAPRACATRARSSTPTRSTRSSPRSPTPAASLFFGVGTSAPLCQDAAYRFSAIGVLAEAPADVHVQHVQARLLSDQDVAVIVSHTGSTRETLAAAAAARARRCHHGRRSPASPSRR